MNCPHCGKRISRKQLAASLGKIKSERKAKTSAENGKLGGRPKKWAGDTALREKPIK